MKDVTQASKSTFDMPDQLVFKEDQSSDKKLYMSLMKTLMKEKVKLRPDLKTLMVLRMLL